MSEFKRGRVGVGLIGLVILVGSQSLGCGAESAGVELAPQEEDGVLGEVQEPAIYCGSSYEELIVDPARPGNAVGLLNNGCTAFLIDGEHIAAAGHCFTFDDGTWQTDLRFYPNFHPNRVKADARRVPRATVDRIVVGSRVNIAGGDGEDWGIAHLTNWQDTGSLDLTPISLANKVPTRLNHPLVTMAYTRHHLPYNDNDSVTWDNMEWDTANCGWVLPDNGMWAVKMKSAPIFDGVNRDRKNCNSRWSAGFVHNGCGIDHVSGGVVFHNCDSIGGSSGSPVLTYDVNEGWVAIALTHGAGGLQNFSDMDGSDLTCTPYSDTSKLTISPSVDRFRHAPRYASNVAINRSADNASATAVFAVDSDRDIVTYRARKGSPPTYSGEFGYWSSLGRPKPSAGTHLTRIAACAQSNAKPQVFVVLDDATIHTRAVDSAGAWGSWSSFALPSGVTSVQDLDASADNAGRCQLFMVAKDGNAYTLAKTSDTTWGSWSTVAAGTYRRVTALNADGVLWAALVDVNGDIWRTSSSSSGWSVPVVLPRLSGLSWADVDMTWDEAGRAFMLAIPTTQTNLLHFAPMYGSSAWSWWHFDTQLWAPQAATPQPAPRFESITASRWMEDPSGTVSPVIMATDDSGNVYLVEYKRRKLAAGWDLRWKSFYHETIPD